jgi:hypothetical protein
MRINIRAGESSNRFDLHTFAQANCVPDTVP